MVAPRISPLAAFVTICMNPGPSSPAQIALSTSFNCLVTTRTLSSPSVLTAAARVIPMCATSGLVNVQAGTRIEVPTDVSGSNKLRAAMLPWNPA